jgi:hypothetical protein
MDRSRLIRIFVAGLAALAATPPQPGPAQDLRRPTIAGAYSLELSGATRGSLRGVSGGTIQAPVISQAQSGSFAKKHIGAPVYEDLALEFGPGMDPMVYEWIAGSWRGTSGPVSGAVLLGNYNLEIVQRIEFEGILAETTIPALDASSKDPASITAAVRPEFIKHAKGGGSAPQTQLGGKQTAWLSGHFRMSLPGIDCSRVKKIDAFKVTSKAGSAQFPDLAVTVGQTGSESWIQWFESFVLGGNHGDDQEKNGEIVFLAPDLQTELGRVRLIQVGISGIEYVNAGAPDAMRSLKAQLYCERMEFEWKGGSTLDSNPVKVRILSR